MPEQKETIVILTPAFPANEEETYWVTSVQLFTRIFHNEYPEIHLEVLSFLYPYRQSNYNWKEIPVTSFNGMNKRKGARINIWWKVWKKLKEMNRSHKLIGIFSFWCGECALVGSYFGKLHKKKHLCWISGQDARTSNSMVKFIRPKSEELIAMSAFLAEEFFCNHQIKPSQIVLNGIDEKQFMQNPGIRQYDLCAAGNLENFKQYEIYVRIIARLKERIYGIKAVHFGLGPEMKRLESLRDQLGLQDSLEFFGGRPQEEVIAAMQQSKVFLHPSSYEGFGAVCAEALYAGAYVISFVDPLKINIPQWQIANDENDMVEKAFRILTDPHMTYTPVMLSSMRNSARSIMELFKKK
jgi:glycosyltransferase involved in cell wall biosynthesis